MAVSVPYAAAFPDGTAYPAIPLGTTTVNVSSASQLTSALSSATAGQRIVLANGPYSGDFTISGKNGTSSNGISIEAATTGGAVFSSGSTFTVKDCAYVTVKGLLFNFDGAGDVFQFRGSTHHSRITRCTFGPATHTSSSEVSTYIYVGDTAQHIRIDHNEVRNKGTSGNGVRVYGSFDTYVGCKYVRIDHNVFRSIKPEVGNDKEPIRYGVSTMSRTDAFGVIERNFFTDCLCEPEIISVKMGRIRTTGNIIYRCAGGPVIRHGRNSIMSDNYIVDRNNTTASAGLQSGGIRFYDSGHEISHNYIDGTIGEDFQDPLLLDTGDAEGSSTNLSAHWRVINALVERNTLVNTPRGITIGDNYSSAPQNCSIKDNLVVNTPTGTAITQRIAPSGGSISGNLYFASTAAAGMTQDAATIWRKASYGPRLTYLQQADVGPTGDTSDTDGTGALVTGGSGGDELTPATILDIGSGATEQHFNLTYGADGTSGGAQITKTLAEIEAGFDDPNYFTAVEASGTAQTLGVGGIPTPAPGPNVTLITADSTSTLTITTPNRIYDGQGHTVKKIDIQASGVTVQNFYVRGASNSGIYSLGANNTIQNCDIAQVSEAGTGDINGITFFGDGTKILFNNIDNLVAGDPGDAHTDGIQCWATPSKNSSSNVIIKGNRINGPAQADPAYIHQGIMAEGPESQDGGGGGTGVSRNWVVDGNYFKTYGNQCLKFDDIHDVTITRNTFAGSATKLIETGDFSTGIDFYNDNQITGSFGSNGVSIIPEPGPGGGAVNNAVQFRVRADAATGGGTFPRNELRETLADGTAYSFDAMVGQHTLHTRARITRLPTADPEVIVAQLHNGTTDRVSVRTQLIAGQTALVCHINGVQATPQFVNPYVLGTEFEVLIKILPGGVVNVHYNGAISPTVTGQLTSTGSASWSFRVGAHAQFDATSAGGATEWVTVEHRDIQVTHSGTGVSAGADTRVILGQAFTRTATEIALSGVTSRKWEIVSAPPGVQATPDLTTAAGRYGWGDPIPEWSDEFNYTGSPNSAKWSLYSGVGHNGNGRRRPERCNVDGQKLIIDGLENGDSGGMRNRFDLDYGRWECRVRCFNTGSSGEEYHALLLIWPESNSRQQDGEYDFYEISSPGADTAEAYIHFPHPGTSVVQQRHFEKAGVNTGEWHNFALEKTADHIRCFIDGEIWFTTSGGANDVRRDIQDMPAGHLCIQLDNFNGTSGNRPGRIEVDWSRVYSLTPTGGGGGTTTELSTTQSVNWTPTTLGTYTLRYTVVAASGTYTDDVIVTVDDTPGGPQTVTPSSITSDERWGQPIVEVMPPAGAVPSLLGAMILNETAYLGYAPGPGALMIVPASIPSVEHFGLPTVVVEPPPEPIDITPDSIPTRERWGPPVVTIGAAPPDLPVTDISISLFAIDPSEGRGLPLPDFVSLTLSPERNSPGSISLEYPSEGVNFGFLREAITDGRDVLIEIWVSGTSRRALRGYLQEAEGDETNEDGQVWTFAGQFLEVRMSEAIIEPQDPGPSPAEAAQLIHQRMVAGGHIDDDLTWDGAPAIVELYAPLILEQWIEDRDEDETSPIPTLAWLVSYVGDPDNQEHANEKREMIFAAATPGQVMIYAMDQARRRGTLTDVAVDFTADFDSDGTPWPQVISTRFSPGVEYARILDRLVEFGLAEWAVEWTGTAQVLRMWVPEGRGVDRTVGDNPIVLRHGQNLLDAPHKWSVRDTGTFVLVAGADGLYDSASDATAQAVRGRRIEKYASQNNLNTPTAVEAYAQQQLTVVTTPLLEVTHGIGMEPGAPRPIVSFDVGDWLYSDTDGQLNRFRVVQWTLTVSNDQSVSGTVTLNDTVADALLRLKARMDALTAGETVVGTSEGAFQSDQGVPNAPTGVVVSSTAFLVQAEPSATNPTIVPSAEVHAAVTIGWLPVTHNTNGSAANDLGGYKAQYAYDQEPDKWIGVEDVGPNTTSTTFDASPGVNLRVRVAAYDRNGNVSDWSAIVPHTVATEDTPPPAPSQPTVTEYLGTIRVLWDGNTADGVDMMAAAPDYSHIEVHMAAGANFTPGGSTLVGQMRGPGAFSITDMPYGVEQFVRLVAVDVAGNLSAPSVQGSAIPGKLVNIDIGPDAISRVQIIDGEIVNAKIADLAVNDAKIMSMSVGKLTAGFLQADIIMSTGEIRTGTGNTYGVFSSGGIQFYRAGLLTVDLNAATGDALLTGTYRSGLVGERINITPDGTLKIFGASGTDFGSLANEGGSWKATSRADGSGNRSVIYFNPWSFTIVYGNSSNIYSRFDTGITYGVLNAPVTGIRVWTQYNPTDGTENRFHFVHANASGDLNDTVLHYVLNDYKGDDPSILAPGLSPEGAGITWSNNAVAATRGNGNAYVFVDGADFRALSSELMKRDIAPIRFGARTARDVVDAVASYGFVYDWPIEPRTVPVERRQPDGSMKVVSEPVDTTPTGPPHRHYFPLAEHLAAVAPGLVQTNPQGELAVGLRDVVGVLWENSRELSRELRELRRVVTGEPEQPIVVEGSVRDENRWAELPERVQWTSNQPTSTSTPPESSNASPGASPNSKSKWRSRLRSLSRSWRNARRR